MVTITEDYVSFEVAKLLKEKGFNYPCRVVYSPKGIVKHYLKEEVYAHHLKGHKKLCPTHQMAMKWLREVHKIYIVISPISGKGYGAILCDVRDFDDFNYIKETDYFFHPEEAVEAALKYSLKNLI